MTMKFLTRAFWDRTTVIRGSAILVVLMLCALALWGLLARPQGTQVLIVQPEHPPEAAAAVLQAWADALREEGFNATPVSADAIERSGLQERPRGLILPDSALKTLGDRTISEIYRYAHEGGQVLVCFDAGTLRLETGAYSDLRSRLSSLVGLDYAQYRERHEAIFHQDTVVLTPAGLRELAVQPGKTESTPAGQELKTYGYAHLTYPLLSNSGPQHAENGPFRGEVLATAARGDIAIARSSYGKGQVLFVNLPVGYLKTRSDGYLLHQSLRLFMSGMARMPQLLAVPDGIGGLVLNVHVDSGAAVSALKTLEDHGVFKQGPFSLHFTAGPDTYRKGDRAGLDIDHNEWVRSFIRRAEAAGHEIGSHGGWSHNEFGLNVNEENEAQYLPYLDWNLRSLKAASGHPPNVYSAPVGNQPLWTNRWLERNGFVAYYDTGGSGLGPTRAWRAGHRADATLWSFPVANFKTVATFEELEDENGNFASSEEVAEHKAFAPRLMDYVAQQRVARLTYFHAPAGARHLDVVDAWLSHGAQAQAQSRYRWYRMDALAGFMSRREQTRWSFDAAGLRAENPLSLAGLTWRVPAAQASQFAPREGRASVEQDGQDVLIRVTDNSKVVVVDHR